MMAVRRLGGRIGAALLERTSEEKEELELELELDEVELMVVGAAMQ